MRLMRLFTLKQRVTITNKITKKLICINFLTLYPLIIENESSLIFDKQIQNFCLSVMNLGDYIRNKN